MSNLRGMTKEQKKEFYANRFEEHIAAQGGTVVGDYEGANLPVDCICCDGHECEVKPSAVQQNQRMCNQCDTEPVKKAKEEFYEIMKNNNFTEVGKYTHARGKVHSVCPNGHECHLCPEYIKDRHKTGKPICSSCGIVFIGEIKNPKRTAESIVEKAEKDFYDAMEEHNFTEVGKYEGSRHNVESICREGHECSFTPHYVQQCIKIDKIICQSCNPHTTKSAALNFYKGMEKIEATPLEEYERADKGVPSICCKGHPCSAVPSNVRRNVGICMRCVTSKGEKCVGELLAILDIVFEKQGKHPSLLKLEFDFKFIYNGKTVYMEYDGEQHQKEFKRFCPKEGDFERCRQRDLIKNYMCAQSSNTRLIRIDHTWMQSDKKQEKLGDYIVECLESKDQIVADPEMYTWIDDVPTEETKQNYIIVSKGKIPVLPAKIKKEIVVKASSQVRASNDLVVKKKREIIVKNKD